ncbi:MAG: glycosyltransferase 87 family protein [Elusimicrobiaceae bacterium]|nr:glycosyltransferase 87 family protein [Elusimicrobiaceae bacterium]
MQSLQKLKTIIALTLAGMALAAGYHAFIGAGEPAGYQYGTFLFSPHDRYNDFINEHKYSKDPYGKIKFTNAHFPFLKQAVRLLARADAETGLFVLLMLFAAAMLGYAAFSLKRFPLPWRIAGIITLGILNYPVLFAFDRAHLEIIVFSALVLSVGLLNARRYAASAAALAIAMALNPLPAIFLLLFVKRRQYRCALLALALAAALTAGSYALLPGGFARNWHNHRLCLDAYCQQYVTGPIGLLCRHSLFGAVRTVLRAFSPDFLRNHTALVLNSYLLAVMAIFGAAMLGFFKYARQVWMELAILVCCMTLLPYLSADYRLLYFFIPLFYYINTDPPDPLDDVFCMLFALILVPKAYINQFTSVMLSPLIIGLLLVFVLQAARQQALHNAN